MINFCIDKALKGNVTSYVEAEKDDLRRMKGKWNYSTHFCYSCKMASPRFKYWRKKLRKNEANPDKPPRAKNYLLDSILKVVSWVVASHSFNLSINIENIMSARIKTIVSYKELWEYKRKLVEKSNKSFANQLGCIEPCLSVLLSPSIWTVNVKVTADVDCVGMFTILLVNRRTQFFLEAFKSLISLKLVAPTLEHEENLLLVRDFNIHSIMRQIG